MTQSVKHFPCKREDPSLVPRTFLRKPVWWYILIVALLDVWRQADLWSLLARQTKLKLLIPKSQRDSVYKNKTKQKTNNPRNTTQAQPLVYTHAPT